MMTLNCWGPGTALISKGLRLDRVELVVRDVLSRDIPDSKNAPAYWPWNLSLLVPCSDGAHSGKYAQAVAYHHAFHQGAVASSTGLIACWATPAGCNSNGL